MSPGQEEHISDHPKRHYTLAATCLFFFLTLAFGSFTVAAPIRSLQEIRHEGVVIQKWDTSCGAAALATVLTYSLNDPVSEREVARGHVCE